MQTYPLIGQESGVKYAFEIENAYIGSRQAAKLLAEVPGVAEVRRRRLFGANSEVHAIFKYKSKDFVIWEPFGDNSRFWIGPKEPDARELDISPIESVFREHRPALLRRAIGNLLMLRFLPGRST